MRDNGLTWDCLLQVLFGLLVFGDCPVGQRGFHFDPSSVVPLKVLTGLRWTALCVREELVCEGGRARGDERRLYEKELKFLVPGGWTQ